MSKPLVSVVITCHNYERYICQCIESCLAQDYSSKELIIVDAGSTDNSLSLMKLYKEAVIVSAPKGSHVLACQAGFSFSNGEWILFLDADDFLFNGALSEALTDTNASQVKIQFNLQIAWKNALSNRYMTCFPDKYSDQDILIDFKKTGTYLWPVTSGNLYRRSFLKQVFPLNKRLPFDGQLNTVAPLFGMIKSISKPLGCYRLHDFNMDNQGKEPHNPERFRKNIYRRYREIAWARTKAKSHNLAFPNFNPISTDLPFLSYRFFLKKLNYKYFLSYRDNCVYLLLVLFKRILFLGNSLKFRLFFIIWHSVVFLSPNFLVIFLLKFRFTRR